MDMAVNNAVIYHGGCTDGFASVYELYKADLVNETTRLIPSAYHMPFPHDLVCDELYIVDFSYPMEDLLKALERGITSIVLIDHHLTAFEKYKTWLEENDKIKLANVTDQVIEFDYSDDQHRSIDIKIDMRYCGAYNVNRWIDQKIQSTEITRFLEYVNDRDMWHNKMMATKAIANLTQILPKAGYRDISLWARLEVEINDDKLIYSAIDRGLAIEEYKNSLIDLGVRKSTLVGCVRIINSIYELHSDLGAELWAQDDTKIGMPYVHYQDDNVYKYGLRGDGSVDVRKIAEHFGGGGHHDAAGMVISATKTPLEVAQEVSDLAEAQ